MTSATSWRAASSGPDAGLGFQIGVAALVLAVSMFAAERAKAGPERPTAANGEATTSSTVSRTPALPPRKPPAGPVRPEAQGSTPRSLVFVPALPPGTIVGEAASRPEALPSGPRPTVSKSSGARPDADAERVARPGAFRPERAAVPSPFAKTQIIDQRNNPDLEVGVADRTTLGVFSDAGTIERTDIRNSTVRPTRDLGAGVTLQYKFGQ